MKFLFFSLLFLLFSMQYGRSQQLVMSLEWICSTTNTADFQVRLTNTGSVPLTFNALIVRGVHDPTLTTGVISWQALNDNTIPEWLVWPQFTTNLAYNPITRQLNFSSNVTIFTSVTAPLLAPGSNVIVGSFKMFTSTTWVPNSNFNFVWAPTGAVNCYLPGMTTVTSFQQTGFSSNNSCGQCLTVTASIAQPLNLSAPTSPANQIFCSAATVSDLIASPLYTSPQTATILWYNSQTGGTALNPTTLLSNGTYYASQIVNYCESLTRSATTVSISPSNSNTTPISACGSYTWTNNGQTYTTSGTYTGATINCVTETLDLTISPSNSNTTLISACGSYIWANNGQTYTTSGTYSGATANCVTEILDLTITPTTINTTLISACGTYTWANNGQTYTTSGTYAGATVNCVTETLDLTISPSNSNTTPISACGSYTWTNNGQTYTTSGTYTGVTINCVTETLNLTIIPNTTNTTLISACGTYTWANNGQAYTASGIYSGTTANCVTEILNLTITPTTINTTLISACGSYTWLNNSQTYTTSGIYSGTTVNCVTETLNLTIIPNTTNTTLISACGTYTWLNNGQTYTSSGIYSETTANCVTEILDLTITPSTTNTTPISACGSYTWANNGQTYTSSGVFNGTTTNCITQVLNLNITPNSSFTTTISECDTYTWANNGQTYTASGVFNGTVINCVLQVLDLEIIDCNSDSDNDGLTDYDESFLCTNSSLFDTDGDGISDGDEDVQGSDPCDPCDPDNNLTGCGTGIHIPTAFSPNGSGFSENNVYQIIAGQDIAKIDFKIIDRWGKIIFESEDKKFQWDGSYKGQKCNNGVYAYFVDLSYSTGRSETLSGYITLIR
jgi:gliding motility-associated-like protein